MRNGLWILLLVLGALLYLLLGEASAPPGDSTDRAQHEAAQEDADPNAALDKDLVEVGDKGSSARVVESEEDAIRGRVVGVDGFREVEVLAFEDSPSYEQVLRGQGELIARANVAENGGFHLPLSKDLEVTLCARGRYVWSEVVGPHRAGDVITLDGNLGAYVHGTVQGPQGGAAARLRFRATEGDIHFRQETLQDGSFEIRGLPAESPYTIIAVSDALAAGLERERSFPAGEDSSLDFALTTGGSVSGEVVDEHGNAIEGAEVDALIVDGIFGGESHTVREAVSDAQGFFRLDFLPTGTVALRARMEGRLESGLQELEVREGEVSSARLELSTGQVLAGRVTFSDDTPAEGARVHASFDPAFAKGVRALGALRGATAEALTNEQGQFTLSGLGGGPFVLRAQLEAQGPETTGHHRARLDGIDPSEPPKDLHLVLLPPMNLAGEVQDLGGVPLDTFYLLAERVVPGESFPVSTHSIARTFEEGVFLLEDLTAGEWQVRARAEGYGSSEVQTVTLPTQERLLFRLEPEAIVSGTVFGSDGHPISDARVRHFDGRDEEQIRASNIPGGAETRTDANGQYELRGLPSGSHRIQALAQDWVSPEPRSIDLTAGLVHEGVDFTLTRGGRISGEVWSDDGLAVGFIVVRLQFGASGSQSTNTSTDGQGRFHFDTVPAGVWILAAINPSSDIAGEDAQGTMAGLMKNSQFKQVTLEDGEHEQVVIGTPTTTGIDVSGRVTRAGEGVDGRVVAFYPGRGATLRDVTRASTDENGRFECRLARRGEYLVVVESVSPDPTYYRVIETRLEVDGHRPIEIELATGRIAGVVQLASGEPAVHAPVVLTPAARGRTDRIHNGHGSYQTTDSEGRFEVDDLGPGQYVLTAGGRVFTLPSADFAQTRVVIDLARGQAREDVRLVLPEPSSARCLVVDESGAPVPGATVHARREGGGIVDEMSLFVTGEEGTVLVTGLPPGTLTFEARDGARSSGPGQAVKLESGAQENVRLVLSSATRVTVHLRDATGPVAAEVRFLNKDGHDVGGLYTLADWSQWSDSEDHDPSVHTSGPIPPGSYTVVAIDGDRRAEKKITLAGEPSREVVLRLK